MLRDPKIPRKTRNKKQKTFVNRLTGTQRTRAQTIRIYLQKWRGFGPSSNICVKRFTDMPSSTCNRLVHKNKEKKTPYGNTWPLLAFLKAEVGADTFSPLETVLGPKQKKLAMLPSSTVHGGQCDTKYVTFE